MLGHQATYKISALCWLLPEAVAGTVAQPRLSSDCSTPSLSGLRRRSSPTDRHLVSTPRPTPRLPRGRAHQDSQKWNHFKQKPLLQLELAIRWITYRERVARRPYMRRQIKTKRPHRSAQGPVTSPGRLQSCDRGSLQCILPEPLRLAKSDSQAPGSCSDPGRTVIPAWYIVILVARSTALCGGTVASLSLRGFVVTQGRVRSRPNIQACNSTITSRTLITVGDWCVPQFGQSPSRIQDASKFSSSARGFDRWCDSGLLRF